MHPLSRSLSGLVLLLFLSTINPAAAEVTQADRDLVNEVAKRLLAVAPEVKLYDAWPPTFDVEDNPACNAFAQLDPAKQPKRVPKIVIYKGEIEKVAERIPDRLALTMGHELGHVILGHILPRSGERTEFIRKVFDRQQEIDSDMMGMELVLKAGYSYRDALKNLDNTLRHSGSYCSLVALSATHPSWKDRISLLNKEQSKLWRAMSAFDNGVFFLTVEQYAAAERCFDRVVKEFPGCYEGYANLGYTCLMQYCDGLEEADLRLLNVGQIVCGGFYRRPESLERLRGMDEEMWWKAIGALKESLRLKPDQMLAKANLGLAYLVRPGGKDLKTATKFLEEAGDQAGADATLDPLARAALAINRSVADLAAGRPEEGAKQLERAESLGREAAGKQPVAAALASAVLYNRALVLAASGDAMKKTAAVEALEKYLLTTTPASAWWALAYERYTNLCKAVGKSPRAEAELKRSSQAKLRLVTSVKLGDAVVSLSDRADDVVQRLGGGDEVPVVKGTNLKRRRYADKGFDLIVANQVLAICLRGQNAPALPVRGSGLGAKEQVLRVGMAKEEFEKIVDTDDYDFRQLDDPEVSYRFYRAVGVAVRIRKGVVEEIVVVQMPRRG